MSLPKRPTRKSNNENYAKHRDYQSDYHNKPRGERRDEIEKWKNMMLRHAASYEARGYDEHGVAFGAPEHDHAIDVIWEEFKRLRAEWEVQFPK